MRDEWQIDCSDHGPVVATWPKCTRVYFTGTRVNSPSSMQTKPKPKKKKHVTHHSSQNLLDPRNPRGPIQTCNIWTLDVTTPWRPPQWASWVCRTYSVCVGLVPGWESLKIRWLNYHLCHCPHWSLIYAHCGRKSMSPLSNTPTCIWICTDFFPTHPVFFFK